MFSITPTVLDVIKVIVQVLALAWLFYKLYMITSSSSAFVMVKILIVLFVVLFIIQVCKLDILSYFIQLFFTPIIIFLVVLYRDELKHGFNANTINRTRKYKNGGYISSDNIATILDAVYTLAGMKRGALIVIPRNIELKKIIDSGTQIDAMLSSNMILTIFDHDTPFHDGAIVVREDRIVAAACFLPLSEQTNISQTLGTRHRAALGLSEVSDALIIVASEETKKVSVCFNGEIKYDLSREECMRTIKQCMMFRNEGMPSFSPTSDDTDNWSNK